MDARLDAEARPLMMGAKRVGTVDERAAAMVRQRVTFFERIAPYKRSGNLARWRSSFLQDRHRNLQRALRADLQLWLPEIEGAPAHVIEAMDLVTSFEAWDRLRTDRKLGVQAARSVVEGTLRALLREVPRKPAKPAARSARR
jgi:hypothetical protein